MTSVPPIFDGKPYIFFSYAHKNYASLQIVTMLQEEGFRVWYDHGLIPGDDQYNTTIEARIRDCAVIIPAISMEYCHSEYCSRELVFAREGYKKPVLPLYLESPEKLMPYYTHGIGLWLSGETGIILDKVTSMSDLKKQIHKVKVLQPCNKDYDDILPQNQQPAEKPGPSVPTFDEYLSSTDERAGSGKKNSPIVNSLLTIVQKDIEAKRFAQAQQHLDSILAEDPANADARYYQLLVKYGVRNLDQLAGMSTPLDPADIRAASLLQSQERRDALADALTANQNYQQYILGSTHMKEGRYQTAITVFSKIPDYRDSGAKLEKCREAIAQDELKKAYKKEVGDGKKYLAEQLKLKDPQKYTRYSELCDEVADKSTNGLIFIIFALALADAAVGLFIIPDNKILFWFSVVFSVLFGLFCCFINPFVGIGVIAVLILLLIKFKSALAVIMIILAAISLAIGISEWRSRQKYKKDLAEKESYYEKYIKDFEETERKALQDRYAALPEKDHKPLMSIEEAFREMKKHKS